MEYISLAKEKQQQIQSENEIEGVNRLFPFINMTDFFPFQEQNKRTNDRIRLQKDFQGDKDMRPSAQNENNRGRPYVLKGKIFERSHTTTRKQINQ